MKPFATSSCVALVVAVFIHLANANAAQHTPLPSNVKVALPDSGISPEVAAFLGIWVGRWDEKLDITVVVQKILPPSSTGVYKTKVIYSWGISAAYFTNSPGYRELDGEITNDRIRFQLGDRIMEFQIAKDLSTLSGSLQTPRTRGVGTFKKVSK